MIKATFFNEINMRIKISHEFIVFYFRLLLASNTASSNNYVDN